MNKILTYEQVKNKLADVLDEVSSNLGRVVVTKDGKDKVVILSKEEFEGWQETLEVASDQELVGSIKRSLQEAKDGKTIPLEQVVKDLNIGV